MNSEVIDVTASSTYLQPITQRDVTTLRDQHKLIKKFISSQMKEADFTDKNAKNYGVGDYGTIPGTKKPSLLKPGAEKLLKLFGLGHRVKLIDKTIDKEANLAVFIYQAEVFHLRTGSVLAQCEGSANSQEAKYKERTAWKGNVCTKEETPIFDILNTLMKMAQKRAIVGATITATGASDYFTQDLEDNLTDEKNNEETNFLPADDTGKTNSVEKPLPICCDQPMMISKYKDPGSGEYPWYCVKCRKKAPSGVTVRGDA